MSNEVDHLQYWLENLKKDARLTPQQFSTLEKAILLAISMFEQNLNCIAGQILTNEEEPMEIDSDVNLG
jgi:hypothetical protein